MIDWQKVEKINDILLRGEPGNVQRDERYGGRVLTGYTPQAVVDAVNKTLGPDGWTYTVDIVSTHNHDTAKSSYAVAKVCVRIGDVQREAFGEGTSPGGPGEALKSATTDALKKALAAFSIGNRAYHGLLPDPYAATPEEPGHTSAAATTEDKLATEKQMNLLHALLRTVSQNEALQRQHMDFFHSLRENMRRGIRLSEASDAIDTIMAMGVKPTWRSPDE